MLQHRSPYARKMTLFAKKVEIFLWQIVTVISIRSVMTHIIFPWIYAAYMAETIISGNRSKIIPRNRVFGMIARDDSNQSRRCLEAWHIDMTYLS